MPRYLYFLTTWISDPLRRICMGLMGVLWLLKGINLVLMRLIFKCQCHNIRSVGQQLVACLGLSPRVVVVVVVAVVVVVVVVMVVVVVVVVVVIVR